MKLKKHVKSNKRLSRIFTGALVMCSLLFVGGCATKEQREALAKIEEQAEINAVDYISEKYGFEAEVVDVEGHTGEGAGIPTHEPTGYATVTVKYDGKEFDVYITGEEASSEGKDNYQKELIWADIEERTKSVFDIEADDIHIAISYGGTEHDIMTSTYYDGNNIELMLEEMDCSFNYKVVALNADLQNVNTDNMHDELSNCAAVVIFNCTDDTNYERLKEAHMSAFWMELYDYAMYMDDCILISSREVEYIDLKMIERDGYTIGLLDGTYCDITERHINTEEWEGNGFLHEPEQVFGAYAIETDARRVFFYINVDELDTKDYENAQIAITYYSEGKKRYDNGTTTECINDSYITDNISIFERTGIVFTVLED